MSKDYSLGVPEINHIPETPLFTVEIKDPEFQLSGWVVIHSIGANGACGGVRLYPDINLQEVEL